MEKKTTRKKQKKMSKKTLKRKSLKPQMRNRSKINKSQTFYPRINLRRILLKNRKINLKINQKTQQNLKHLLQKLEKLKSLEILKQQKLTKWNKIGKRQMIKCLRRMMMSLILKNNHKYHRSKKYNQNHRTSKAYQVLVLRTSRQLSNQISLKIQKSQRNQKRRRNQRKSCL
jgi:hypothetical protein